MSRADAAAECASRNEVLLVGRLAAPPEQRELPSGDPLVTWRLVVHRPPGGSRTRKAPEGTREVTVDALDCVAWMPALQRAAGRWQPGDVIAVEGALRRRFWRGGGGLGSRYEVEVARAKRVQKAA